MQKHLIRDNILYTGASAGIMIMAVCGSLLTLLVTLKEITWILTLIHATDNTETNNVDIKTDSLTFGIKVLFQFVLLEVGMALDLVHSWYNLGCLKQTFCFCV